MVRRPSALTCLRTIEPDREDPGSQRGVCEVSAREPAGSPSRVCSQLPAPSSKRLAGGWQVDDGRRSRPSSNRAPRRHNGRDREGASLGSLPLTVVGASRCGRKETQASARGGQPGSISSSSGPLHSSNSDLFTPRTPTPEDREPERLTFCKVDLINEQSRHAPFPCDPRASSPRSRSVGVFSSKRRETSTRGRLRSKRGRPRARMRAQLA